MLPIGHCRQCDGDILSTDDYVELVPGVYVCIDCAPGILEETDAIIPYWFERPLVDGEPAQPPVQRLEPIPEPEWIPELPAEPESTANQIRKECISIAQEPVLAGSQVPLFDALTQAEQMKWIMIGQTGRGDAYDVQMLAQYKKWMDEKEKR